MMRALRLVRRLPAGRRRLLLPAAAMVTAMRVALWLLPARIPLRYAQGTAVAPADGGKEGRTVRDIAWAVDKVSRRIPSATCLTQALSAQVLLARAGHNSVLRIGVARSDDAGFRAHAWLEYEGRVVVGGDGLHEFTPLPDLRLTRQLAR